MRYFRNYFPSGDDHSENFVTFVPVVKYQEADNSSRFFGLQWDQGKKCNNNVTQEGPQVRRLHTPHETLPHPFNMGSKHRISLINPCLAQMIYCIVKFFNLCLNVLLTGCRYIIRAVLRVREACIARESSSGLFEIEIAYY